MTRARKRTSTCQASSSQLISTSSIGDSASDAGVAAAFLAGFAGFVALAPLPVLVSAGTSVAGAAGCKSGVPELVAETIFPSRV